MKHILQLPAVLLTAILLSTPVLAQQKFLKELDDINTKYTNTGNIGITITNFGTYGHGFSKWPQQPSCEYPIGSGIEHIFDGGLWIGGFRMDDSLGSGRVGPFVTTGAVDAASAASRGGGFEWTNDRGATIKERSSLLTSRYFNTSAVSHQDFVMDFTDTNRTLSNGEIIENHSPLGLNVHLETYAWNYPFADYFVIFNYWVKNVSGKFLDSIYTGLWTDAVVRNTKATPPGGSSFFNKGGDGYSDSLHVAYEFDANGDIGLTDSYIGFAFLGANARYDSVNFVSWQYKNTADVNFFAPQVDVDRYIKMQGFFGGTNRYPWQINPASLKSASNRSLMISAGPFRKLKPGDSVNVVFAIVCAKKFGNDPAALDNEEQKKNLYGNVGWALRAYYGEDRNRNGQLDPGEDNDGDGKITRYILPTPPTSPAVKVIPESNKATIYWDKRAESSVDPISGKRDFEGYRLYRTNTGFDLTLKQDIQSALVKLGEYDSLNNTTGYNTGFNAVRLASPVTFPGDTTKYYYKTEVNNLLNGWQYLFTVTAFDKRDDENNIESLESSLLANLQRILPGTPAANGADAEVGVYPNPYYGNAIWDGSTERLRKIYFFNLPEECIITVYTLAGDIVKRMNHDASNTGSDIQWFQNYSGDNREKFAGGEHAWDLVTDNEQAIATGLYLFTVENTKTGDIKRGKFLIVK